MRPRVSIVIPAYNEGEQIVECLDRVLEAVTLSCEVLVVYDTPDDTTVPYIEEYATTDPRVVPCRNPLGRGAARAIRAGLDAARADVVVVTMADGSDDPRQIDELACLVEGGAVIASASRYMKGGRQVGGPVLKGLLSRLAGLSLHHLARVGTHDATNSFKAYATSFVRAAAVESDSGFETGIELVAKARRRRLPVAEVATVWRDRTAGQSNFKLLRWAPGYLRWWLHAFGPPERSSP